MQFTQLPQNCADRIFNIIRAEYGMPGIDHLRLVSKAWLAAVQQYPGTAKDSSKLDKLDPLQRIMPNLRKLYITHNNEGSTEIDLTPLANCPQLISLNVTAELWPPAPHNWEIIYVEGIPNTLRKLKVRKLSLDAKSFNNAAASLTKLVYHKVEMFQEDEWEFLEHLPHLKVQYSYLLHVSSHQI